jgi:outer membrane protein assembly factor BamB
VDGDAVLIGSGDGHIYVVQVSTGRQRWALATGGPIRSSRPRVPGRCTSAAVIWLFAVDAMTGAEQWSFGTYGPVDDSSPVLAGHTVCFEPGPPGLCTRCFAWC